MADGSATMPGATAETVGSSTMNAGDAGAMPESGAARPMQLEEPAMLPETSEGVVGRVVRLPSPQVAPPAMEEEDEVEEIEREESRPQAVRILHKQGDEVVVVEEEDTTRELKRLESALFGVMKQIKVSIASAMLVVDIGDRSSS